MENVGYAWESNLPALGDFEAIKNDEILAELWRAITTSQTLASAHEQIMEEPRCLLDNFNVSKVAGCADTRLLELYDKFRPKPRLRFLRAIRDNAKIMLKAQSEHGS